MFKKILTSVVLGALLSGGTAAFAAPPPGYCEVTVCNKLKRFSLSPWAHIKDSIGETCMPAVLGEADAVRGKVLSSESRWYQGSFNPTKSSVAEVSSVGTCTPATAAPMTK